MKKYRFLFLMVFALFVVLPLSVNASSTIDEVIIDFEGAVPVVEEAPKDIIINSNEYEIVFQQWYAYNQESNGIEDEVTTFEYGKTYYFEMYIKAKDSYTFESTVITTKNINWDADYDRGIVTNPDNPYYNCIFIKGTYTTGTINENVKIEGNKDIIPIIGKTPQYLITSLEEYEIESQGWYDGTLNKVTTFEEGETYFYIISLKHKTAHGWDNQSSLEIENIDWLVTYSWVEISDGTLNFAGSLNPVEGYEITVNKAEGVLVEQSGSSLVHSGSNQTLQIVAKEGYKITSVKVNGVEQTLPLENDELTLNNIQEDINVVVEAERCEYKIKNDITNLISSNTATTINSLTEYKTTLSALEGYKLPDMVYILIDGNELNTTSYSYNKETGELVIPVEKVTGNITIVGDVEKIEGEEEKPSTDIEPDEENPNTFDGIGSSIFMGTVSLIGLVGAIIYLKRRNKVRVN